MNAAENSDDSQQTTSALNRRRLTLEHLSARHQQMKQQHQKLSEGDEITKIEDDDQSSKTNDETENKNDILDSSSFLVHVKGIF